MSDELDIIIMDDEPAIVELTSGIIEQFYTWGEVICFADVGEAIDYCQGRDLGVAIFVLDVYLGGKTGFEFLDQIVNKFPSAREDTIIMTGNASNEVVNMCIASDVTYLLEKPIRPYALQLSVRAIVMKYIKFAKRLFRNQNFADSIKKF